MQSDAVSFTSGSLAASAPVGAWLWSRHAGRYVRVLEPARFELHPVTEPDRDALERGDRIKVAAPTFLLWAPEYVPAERIRHRAPVAVALDAAKHDGSPELWLDRKPYVFLRDGNEAPAWLREHRSGRTAWFTYDDGASLHALRAVNIGADHLLVVDVERVR